MTELAEYDSSWPTAFQQAAEGLIGAAGERWPVEHIGSTSVPGMTAKPIIDLAVRVPSFDAFEDRKGALITAGWLPIRRQPADHRVLVREQDGRRTHVAHFFTAGQWDSCHQRLFRDWLLEHPEDRRLYSDAKREAASGVGTEYTQLKQPVVLEIVNRARAARGLPPLGRLDADV